LNHNLTPAFGIKKSPAGVTEQISELMLSHVGILTRLKFAVTQKRVDDDLIWRGSGVPRPQPRCKKDSCICSVLQADKSN